MAHETWNWSHCSHFYALLTIYNQLLGRQKEYATQKLAQVKGPRKKKGERQEENLKSVAYAHAPNWHIAHFLYLIFGKSICLVKNSFFIKIQERWVWWQRDWIKRKSPWWAYIKSINSPWSVFLQMFTIFLTDSVMCVSSTTTTVPVSVESDGRR